MGPPLFQGVGSEGVGGAGEGQQPEQCGGGMRAQQSGAGLGVGGRGCGPPPLWLAAARQGCATGGVQSLPSQKDPNRLQASTNTAATPCIRVSCMWDATRMLCLSPQRRQKSMCSCAGRRQTCHPSRLISAMIMIYPGAELRQVATTLQR